MTGTHTFPPQLTAVGDSALLVTFGAQISAIIHQRVRSLIVALQENPLDGSGEVVPGYATLLIYYDCEKVDYAAVEGWVQRCLKNLPEVAAHPAQRVEVPVYYGGVHGPDLQHVADLHGLRIEDVIRIHSQRDLPVYMMGFMPGFPYLGEMDPVLATPRLATPRSHVPAGSVGIAGVQTGIYPIDSPGGWQIIGWTPLRLFDVQREPPFLLAPGDVVRFVAVEEGLR